MLCVPPGEKLSKTKDLPLIWSQTKPEPHRKYHSRHLMTQHMALFAQFMPNFGDVANLAGGA